VTREMLRRLHVRGTAEQPLTAQGMELFAAGGKVRVLEHLLAIMATSRSTCPGASVFTCPTWGSSRWPARRNRRGC